MASLSTEKKTGTRRILFLDGDRRRTIRLGKMPKKAAESVLARVEHLIAARIAGVALDADTARWLAGLPADLHDRIARVGLTVPRQARETVTLGALLAAFDDDAQHDVKPSTRTRRNKPRGTCSTSSAMTGTRRRSHRPRPTPGVCTCWKRATPGRPSPAP